MPLHEFELPAMTLRPGGVDGFNIATREGFIVPPGEYQMVVATAAPAGLEMPMSERFIEKNPDGIWRSYSFIKYQVSVR